MRNEAAYEISPLWSGRYVWRLLAADGAVVVTSVETYDSPETCGEAVALVRSLAAHAEVRISSREED